MADDFWKDPAKTAPVARLVVSETQRLIEEERLRVEARHEEAATAVVREHPDWSVSRQLGEAMKRTKGSANPTWMRSVIERLRSTPAKDET